MTSFLESGWTTIPALLTRDEVGLVAAECRRLLQQPEEARRPGDKPAGGTQHLVALDRRIPLVDEILDRGALTEAITSFLNAPFERLQVSYRCPRPGFGAQQLHADALPKLDVGPNQVVTAIVPLVDFTTRNGATRLVPGSHRRPDLQRLAGNLASHPEEIRLVGPAGCAFVFSGHVLHSGMRNESETDRPALQLQWQVAG